MGTILGSKILPDNKIKVKISLDEKEALSLQGCIKNIHVASSDLCSTESKVIEKGKNGVTKYFLVPLSLRARRKRHIFEIKCQRIESENKILFAYILNHEARVLSQL